VPIPELNGNELDGAPEEGDNIKDEEVEKLAASLTQIVKDETKEQSDARIDALLNAFRDREPCPATISRLCLAIEECMPDLARHLRHEFGVTDHI
jgi:hypothetical protein